MSRADFVPGSQGHLEQFGIDRVLWPEAQLAADIEQVVIAPGAIDAEVFAGGVIRLLDTSSAPESPLTSAPLGQLHLPRGSLIVAVKRGAQLFVPRGTHRAGRRRQDHHHGHAGGDAGGRGAIVNPSRRDGRMLVTIIGGGDVGLQLAERLEQCATVDLRIMERDLARGEMLAARLTRTLVLNGDGTDLEFLESENVGQSDVLVCVIDNDERNLLASLLGRQLGVPKIVTRVGRPTNLRLFERVGIDVALSARGAAVASILHQITGGTSRLLAVLEQRRSAGARADGLEGFRREAAQGHRHAASTRSSARSCATSSAIVPRGDDRIEPGDRILVFSTRDAADRVQAYFSGSGI